MDMIRAQKAESQTVVSKFELITRDLQGKLNDNFKMVQELKNENQGQRQLMLEKEEEVQNLQNKI